MNTVDIFIVFDVKLLCIKGNIKDGLFRLRTQTDNSYEISQYSQENSALTDNEVYAIAEDKHHRLWNSCERHASVKQ